MRTGDGDHGVLLDGAILDAGELLHKVGQLRVHVELVRVRVLPRRLARQNLVDAVRSVLRRVERLLISLISGPYVIHQLISRLNFSFTSASLQLHFSFTRASMSYGVAIQWDTFIGF